MITPFELEKITRKMIKNLYKGNSKVLLNKTHKQLAEYGNQLVSVGKLDQSVILEVGAGNGELFVHVNQDFKKYYMTDISTWGKNEIELITKVDDRVVFEVQNVEKLSYPNDYFDRVIITCVVAHLTEPFIALEELRRVVKPEGLISIFVSTDPGIFLRIIRKIITNRKKKVEKIWSEMQLRGIKIYKKMFHKTFIENAKNILRARIELATFCV